MRVRRLRPAGGAPGHIGIVPDRPGSALWPTLDGPGATRRARASTHQVHLRPGRFPPRSGRFHARSSAQALAGQAVMVRVDVVRIPFVFDPPVPSKKLWAGLQVSKSLSRWTMVPITAGTSGSARIPGASSETRAVVLGRLGVPRERAGDSTTFGSAWNQTSRPSSRRRPTSSSASGSAAASRSSRSRAHRCPARSRGSLPPAGASAGRGPS